MENKWKNKNFFQAFINSINGIKNVFKTERNLQIQSVITIIVIVFAILMDISAMEWAVLAIAIGGVLFAEIINTAVERMADLYTQEYNKNIKIVKDISSGAVLIMSIVSIIIGIIMFLPKILNLNI